MLATSEMSLALFMNPVCQFGCEALYYCSLICWHHHLILVLLLSQAIGAI